MATRPTLRCAALSLVSLLLLVSCAGPAHEPASTPDRAGPEMTVLLARTSRSAEVTLQADSSLRVQIGGQEHRFLPDSTGLVTISAAARGGELTLAGLGPVRTAAVVAAEGGPIRVNGAPYRGEILLFPHRNGASPESDTLRVCNRVPLESYLRGVVPAEVPAHWPEACLRAQAVAARTYALWERAARSPSAAWDVTDDTRSQVYQGMAGEDPRTDAAVAATEGEVLTYGGELLHTFFHSTCGGHTASAAEIFGEPHRTPLAGRPCTYCTHSKYFTWTAERSVEEVQAAVEEVVKKARQPAPSGPLLELTAGQDDGHDRLHTVLARYEQATYELPASSLRTALGGSALRSTRFVVSRDGDRIRIEGRGWGHGVGLCQVGASGMAAVGHDYRTILSHYYPGSVLARLSSSHLP